MRVTEEHFKEQAVVQSDLKRQLAAQSQLQQEVCSLDTVCCL